MIIKCPYCNKEIDVGLKEVSNNVYIVPYDKGENQWENEGGAIKENKNVRLVPRYDDDDDSGC